MKKYIFLLLIIKSSLGFSQLNEKNDITILKKLTLEDVNYSLKSKTNDGTFLTGIACDFNVWGECTAFVFKNFAGSWELKDKLSFPNTNGEIDNFVSNENLIYFGSHSAGGSSGNGNYYFNAFSFEDNKFYSLEYSWSDFKYSSYGFSNIETIINKNILDYFEKKASDSEYVYKPNSEITLDEAWKIDNKGVYENIFKVNTELLLKYTENPPYEFKEKTAENKDFIIYNMFKDNLYGYNKRIKKYFIIWIPNWNYDTTLFMFLEENNSLGIQDSTLGANGARIYIDLNTNEISGLYKRVGED